ncbi:MAG: cytochrome c [Bacteroidetes bacterium]|nr:cytochrome c [Bacteroidota bacterium]
MKFKKNGAILCCLSAILFIAACENQESVEFKRYYSNGSLIYQQHCQNCHGTNGEGLSALIPPLTDSVYLKNNRNSLACYIRNGLKGKITLDGKEFDDAMPANNLAPMEAAEVITYIQNSFGNKLGLTTIDQAESDLEKCK